MSNETFPTKPESRRHRAAKAIAKRLGGVAAKPSDAQADTDPVFSTVHTSRVKYELRKRGNSLSLGKGKDAFFGETVVRSPLAERKLPRGHREGLTHLIFVGDSVMGVTRELDGRGRLKSARLMLLPLGRQAFTAEDERNYSARTLLTVDADTVPQADGRGKTIKVTRKLIADAYGIEDTNVADKQATVGLAMDGRLEIVDGHSAQGTEILTMDMFTRPQLQPIVREGALQLVHGLETSPRLWASEYADQ